MMDEQTVIKPRRTRNGKNRKMIEQMLTAPGEWHAVKRNQSQHQAHAYASWLRRTYPSIEWAARRDGDTYATLGRTGAPEAAPNVEPTPDAPVEAVNTSEQV